MDQFPILGAILIAGHWYHDRILNRLLTANETTARELRETQTELATLQQRYEKLESETQRLRPLAARTEGLTVGLEEATGRKQEKILRLGEDVKAKSEELQDLNNRITRWEAKGKRQANRIDELEAEVLRISAEGGKIKQLNERVESAETEAREAQKRTNEAEPEHIRTREQASRDSNRWYTLYQMTLDNCINASCDIAVEVLEPLSNKSKNLIGAGEITLDASATLQTRLSGPPTEEDASRSGDIRLVTLMQLVWGIRPELSVPGTRNQLLWIEGNLIPQLRGSGREQGARLGAYLLILYAYLSRCVQQWSGYDLALATTILYDL